MARSFLSSAFERGDQLGPVRLLLHVDEVDDEEPPEVAEADLPDDLLHGLEVRLQDGVLEPALPDELPRVDVDGDERLGLVDDDVPPRLEPDLRLQGVLDLGLDAVLLEKGRRLPVELHLLDELGLDLVEELDDALVLLVVVHEERREVLPEDVARGAEGEVEVAVEEGGRARPLRLLPDLLPELRQVASVGGELLGAPSLAGRPDDEAARPLLQARQNLLQPVPLLLVLDPARDAEMVDRRHVDERPAREGDVRRDPHALVRDHVLRHLDDDLLSFAEKLVDRGERRLRERGLSLPVLRLVETVATVGSGPLRSGSVSSSAAPKRSKSSTSSPTSAT